MVTGRDEWIYDFDIDNLESKTKDFLLTSMKRPGRTITIKDKFSIKWGYDLRNSLKHNRIMKYQSRIVKSLYRPYIISTIYFDKHHIENNYKNLLIFGESGNLDNKIISFTGLASGKDFHCIASKYPIECGITVPAQCIPLYVYDSDGNKKHSNITEWGLSKFRNHYKDPSISAEDIFHYTYAILHDPNYREKYAIDLKRHFPRLPFKEDFWKWSNWGNELMDLHINFESAEPYVLGIEKNAFKGNHPTSKLKSHSEEGIIVLDEETTLKGIPQEAWNYKLGNRSAIDWVLDQYKEKKIRDATIRDKFNTYRFRDYKSQVIDLLQKVVSVSIGTVDVVKEMKR